jgi:FKBP-type peptidyl-prolyl cis-trans isomerase
VAATAMAEVIEEHTLKILQVKVVVKERNRARKELDFDKSDFLRDRLLKEFGAEVVDQKDGPSGWRFKDGKPSKLPPGTKIPAEFAEDLKPDEKPVPNNAKKRDRGEPTPTSAREQKLENKKQKRAREKEDDEEVKQKESKKKARENEKESAKSSTDKNRNSALLAELVPNATGPGRTVDGVYIEDIVTSSSSKAVKYGDRVKAHYIGRLKSNGKVFDSSLKKAFVFRVGRGEVIRGWDIGFAGMTVGSKRKLIIPPEKAYGRQGSPPVIPGNATLEFEVTLLGIV